MFGSARVRFTELVQPSVAVCNAATALQALLLVGTASPIERLVAAHRRLGCRDGSNVSTIAGCVIVDVAHNPHGAAFLSEQLRATHPPDERLQSPDSCKTRTQRAS